MSLLTAPTISAATPAKYASAEIQKANSGIDDAFNSVVKSYVAGFKALWLSPNYTAQQFCDAQGVNAGAYITILENYYAMSLALYPGVITSNYAWAPHTFVIDGSGRVTIGA